MTSPTRSIPKDELLLRELLWKCHGHQGLYGDDGEMQCSVCLVDFKRDDPRQIEERLMEIGLRKLRNALYG